MAEANDPKQDIDFAVFEQKDSKCMFNEMISNCSQLFRIAQALIYYHSFKDNDEYSQNEFIEFCKNVYKTCLDDFIHLKCVHSDSLERIRYELDHVYHLKICNDDSNACQCKQRHFRDRSNKNNNQSRNPYYFYTDIFDTIHIYLLHTKLDGSHAAKYNVLTEENKVNSFDREENDEQRSYTFCDNMLMELSTNNNASSQLIQYLLEEEYDTDEIKTDINFYHENGNNCNILSNTNNNALIIQNIKQFIDYGKFSDIKRYWMFSLNMKDRTDEKLPFIDELFIYIVNKNKFSNDMESNHLATYIMEEEYDTDAFIDDINSYNNISNILNDITFISRIKQFIEYYHISCSSYENGFSTGFMFYYWYYYKNIDDKIIKKQQKYASQQNNFGGYSVRHLYVTKHYQSLKAEALNSSFVDIMQYNNNVIDKTDEYIKTASCKAMTANRQGYEEDLHFGISFGHPLNKKQLHSVILYCDFTDFCTKFRATFRKNRWDESLQSVKSRNSKFFHVAKYLRELIQYYGDNNHWEKKQNSGPFYTGLSCAVHVPSFSIRLNGPTSTTKQKAVATQKFCGESGIIIQFNNKRYPGYNARFFDSSWISSFPEEDERIWFGGGIAIEVESIIVAKEWNNYEDFIPSFYKFEAILSGQKILAKDITMKDVDIIKTSIDIYLGFTSCNSLDNYMRDTFYLFLASKTQIVLKLNDLNQCDNKEFIKFRNLIMYLVLSQNKDSIANNNNNIFKPLIFKLFPNISEIIIYSTEYDIEKKMHHIYSFNLLKLLEILFDISLPKSFKKLIIIDQGQKWLGHVFCTDIKTKYQEKNLNTCLKQKESHIELVIY